MKRISFAALPLGFVVCAICTASDLPVVGGWHSVGWRVGQQIGPFEHPCTGWLYAGGWIRAEHADGSDVAVGLDIGCNRQRMVAVRCMHKFALPYQLEVRLEQQTTHLVAPNLDALIS